MNVRLFFKWFFITFLIASILAAGLLVYIELNKNVGREVSEEVIEVLDEVEESHTRRNVLVIGVDGSEKLADVMMICSFSNKGEPIHLMSIQRDTEVRYNGKRCKLNEVLAYGEDRLIQKIKDITGIPIHDYIKVNFKAVEKIVDTLGGVDFYVPQYMKYDDPEQDLHILLYEGQQRLYGDKALQLLRFRSYTMGDLKRTETQRDFLAAAFEQHAKIKNITKVKGVYDAVEQYVVSSVTYGDILDCADMASGCELITLEMPCKIGGENNISGSVVVKEAEMKKIAETYFAEE